MPATTVSEVKAVLDRLEAEGHHGDEPVVHVMGFWDIRTPIKGLQPGYDAETAWVELRSCER